MAKKLSIPVQRFCRQLEYEFNNNNYLIQALTHRSANVNNNERLEFLGDSILNLVIAEALYQQFPKASEGYLSRTRAFLVQKDTLAEIAVESGLGDCLVLGIGELKTGGSKRASILADALEAIFAAIFLDGNFLAAQNIILRLYASRLKQLQESEVVKDPKTQLQEYLQAAKKPLPEYSLLEVQGEEHAQTFCVRCTVPSLHLTADGKGTTRRKAEQAAAQLLLRILYKEKSG